MFYTYNNNDLFLLICLSQNTPFEVNFNDLIDSSKYFFNIKIDLYKIYYLIDLIYFYYFLINYEAKAKFLLNIVIYVVTYSFKDFSQNFYVNKFINYITSNYYLFFLLYDYPYKTYYNSPKPKSNYRNKYFDRPLNGRYVFPKKSL